MEYVPIGTKASANRPSPFVIAADFTLVAWFVASTLALGTAPPVASVTVPVTVAVFTWATHTAQNNTRKERMPAIRAYRTALIDFTSSLGNRAQSRGKRITGDQPET